MVQADNLTEELAGPSLVNQGWVVHGMHLTVTRQGAPRGLKIIVWAEG